MISVPAEFRASILAEISSPHFALRRDKDRCEHQSPHSARPLRTNCFFVRILLRAPARDSCALHRNL